MGWLNNIIEAQRSAKEVERLGIKSLAQRQMIDQQRITYEQLKDKYWALEEELKYALETVEETMVMSKQKSRCVSLDYDGNVNHYKGHTSKFWFDKHNKFKIKIVSLLTGDLTTPNKRLEMIKELAEDGEE